MANFIAKLALDASGYNREIHAASNKTRKFGKGTESINKGIAGSLANVQKAVVSMSSSLSSAIPELGGLTSGLSSLGGALGGASIGFAGVAASAAALVAVPMGLFFTRTAEGANALANTKAKLTGMLEGVKDKMSAFGGNLSKIFEPAIKDGGVFVNLLLRTLSPAIKGVGMIVAVLAGTIAQTVNGVKTLGSAIALVIRGKFSEAGDVIVSGVKDAANIVSNTIDEIKNQFESENWMNSINKSSHEHLRIQGMIQGLREKQVREMDALIAKEEELKDIELAIADATDDQEKLRLLERKLDLQKSINGMYNEYARAQQAINIAQDAANDSTEAQTFEMKKQNHELQKSINDRERSTKATLKAMSSINRKMKENITVAIEEVAIEEQKLGLYSQMKKELQDAQDLKFTAMEAGDLLMVKEMNLLIESLSNKLKELEAGGAITAVGGVTDALEDMDAMTNTVNDNINSLIQGGIASFAQAIGEAFVSGGENGLKKWLIGIMGMLQQFGAALIAAGLASIAFKKVALSGIGAVIAGGALIVATTAASAAINKATAFADGGIVYGETLGLVGEYPTAHRDPEVIAPLSKLSKLLGDSGGRKLDI
ncbi:MAG: hypothetical protein ACRCZM_08085, partial [Bacteroidales bacterium]